MFFITTPARFVTHLSAVFSLAMAASVYADAPDEQMIINMLEAEYQRGGFKQGADCLGVTEQKLFDAVKANTVRCFKSGSMSDECIDGGLLSSLGVSESKFTHCQELAMQGEGSDIDAKADALMAELDDIYNALDGREPNAQQQAQIAKLEAELNVLMAQQQEQGQAAINDAVALMAESSAGTESSITLPLYPDATMMVHLVAGIEMGGVQSLPAATFASSDNQDKIVAFYKKKLPNFKYQNLGEAGHLFMQNMPENFSMLNNLDVFMTSPHVFVSSAQATGGAPAGTLSIIEVAYKKN